MNAAALSAGAAFVSQTVFFVKTSGPLTQSGKVITARAVDVQSPSTAIILVIVVMLCNIGLEHGMQKE
jgi:hypothetical protein